MSEESFQESLGYCDMTHSFVWHDSFVSVTCVWHDSCTRARNHWRDPWDSIIRWDSFICGTWTIYMTWLIYIYDIHMRWLIHTSKKSVEFSWDSVMWHIHMCEMTHLYLWYICNETRSHVWHVSFIYTSEEWVELAWCDSFIHDADMNELRHTNEGIISQKLSWFLDSAYEWDTSATSHIWRSHITEAQLISRQCIWMRYVTYMKEAWVEFVCYHSFVYNATPSYVWRVTYMIEEWVELVWHDSIIYGTTRLYVWRVTHVQEAWIEPAWRDSFI